jgi:cell division protein FtsL
VLLSLVGAFAVYSLNLHIDSIHIEARINEVQQKIIDLNSNRLTALETEIRSLRNALLRP